MGKTSEGQQPEAKALIKTKRTSLCDRELAAQAARIRPHREDEANGFLALLCRIGLHRWRRLDLADLALSKNILRCFWCSKIKVNRVVTILEKHSPPANKRPRN